MKRGSIFIHCRPPGWPREARKFTQPTAVFIVIRNRSGLITRAAISSANGVIVGVRREITFLIVRYFSEECEWAST
jgi:hypothetical protein